jgi:4-amino-4-deoxy-L-arabinose transferase-like glycosyltransferase
MGAHPKQLRFLLATVLLVAVVDLAILPWYFPPTEGWWETYAWLIENGQRLYSDVWVPFPPLQVLLTHTELGLVGHNFMALRLLGVLAQGLTVSLLYLWLARLTNPLAAFYGAVLSTLLAIELNGAYVSGDYHTTVEFFEVLALICSFSALLSREANDLSPRWRIVVRNALGTFGAGIACGGLFVVKQNIGVFFTAFLGIAIVLRAVNGRWIRQFKAANAAAITFILGFVVLPLAVTIWIGSDWLSVYFNNQSKGKPLLVLARFVIDPDSRSVLFGSFVATILFSRIRWIDDRLAMLAGYFSILEMARAVLSPLVVRVSAFVVAAYFLKLAPSHIVFSLGLGWVAYRRLQSSRDAS